LKKKKGKKGNPQPPGHEEKGVPGLYVLRSPWFRLKTRCWQLRSHPKRESISLQEETAGHRPRPRHNQPRPLARAEVERIFKRAQKENRRSSVDITEGDPRSCVTAGPFKDFQGEVIEVLRRTAASSKPCSRHLGRETPVNWSFRPDHQGQS